MVLFAKIGRPHALRATSTIDGQAVIASAFTLGLSHLSLGQQHVDRALRDVEPAFEIE
jgi:hypothetical protein